MSNYSAKLKQIGWIKESARGIAEAAPTTWVAVDPASEMDYKLNLLVDKALRGVMMESPSIPGTKDGEGTIKLPVRASDIGEFFHMFCDAPVSAEQSTITITLNTNDYIDFIEDGGIEVSAQLTAGTYAIGTTSATGGTLCALIKTAMEAVNGVATYIVTYSYSTKKFTITKDSGVFVILWNTGTNTAKAAKTILGFTNADTASAISAISNSTTTQAAFKHTFTPLATLLPQSYSIWMDRSLVSYVYNRCNVSSIKFSCSPNGFIEMENKIFFESENSSAIGTPAYTESEEMTFQHVIFKIAGAENTEVKSWEVSLENGLFKKRTMSQSQNITDLLVTEHKASGSFVIYFENETERTKFLAGTSTTIGIEIDGDTISGAIKYALHLNVYNAQYTAFPFGEEDGLLAAKVTWKANYSSSDSKMYDVELFNIQANY